MGIVQERIKRLERRLGFRVETDRDRVKISWPNWAITSYDSPGQISGQTGERIEHTETEALVSLWRLCLRLMAEKEKLEAELQEYQECDYCGHAPGTNLAD